MDREKNKRDEQQPEEQDLPAADVGENAKTAPSAAARPRLGRSRNGTPRRIATADPDRTSVSDLSSRSNRQKFGYNAGGPPQSDRRAPPGAVRSSPP